ncbi:MAG: hypothetical protein A2Z69_03675 [Bacteroidetes bacterium RBG_13_44_24]|nr:MAG: hypothetical protein A2Z69_03675 [Bacteroidetes bacterium RBG_13_44_24]
MASNYACRDSFYMDIVVHPNIKSDFTFTEYVNCSPFTVIFNNASTTGATYYWDFGDGSDTITSDMNPVSHTFSNSAYTTNAVFLVTLIAENPEGCTDQRTRTLEVYPDIDASFLADIDEGCVPLRVQFSNVSSGGYTYLWDFGDGTSSSSDSPGHTFTNFTNAPVTRQVRLTATSRYNCVNEITGDITIHPKPLARFETDRIIVCPPFDALLTNTSTNADQYNWNFGDGSTLNTVSGTPFNHTFDNITTNIAQYNVKLVASSTFGCVDSAMQNLYVYPPTIAGFSFNDEGCSPLTSSFVNESVMGETFLWDFGDGSNITVKDPSHSYFNFSDDDISYFVTLTSTSRYGCTDAMTDTVFVYANPAAEFIALPTHQVYPAATVSFTNVTNPGPWTYLWDMDDGSTSASEDPAPYTYSTWGEFNISLYVSSAHCYDSVSHLIRIFASPPIADFDTIIPGCEPLPVQFTNSSLYGNTYFWEFDDGTTSDEFEPVHTFNESGIYNVKLTVTGDGGQDYAYHQVEVFRKPYVNFRVSPALVMLPEQEVQLYNLSENGVIYLWEFGDGNTSTEYNPNYRYTSEGFYDIRLTVWTVNGCMDTLTKLAAVEVVPTGVIVFPNVFEPDMSGPNGGYYSLSEPDKDNIFRPVWEGVEEYRLEIYNRWGVLIYVSEDVMKGWDGYYQGKVAPQGVYVYKCTGTFSNGKPFTHVGDVTLLHHYYN